MKTRLLKIVICLIVSFCSIPLFAKQYCNEVSPNPDFTFSLMNVTGNTYRIQLDAIGDDEFESPYNINCGVNQSPGAGIYFGGDNASSWIITDRRAYLDFTTDSENSVITGFYGNYFCFNKKGGGLIIIENFNPTDVDWTAVCEEPSADLTYRVGGENADYATLADAITDLENTGLSSNVTLLICADLQENVNVGITNNTDYTLTIAPDAAVKRTITYVTDTDNAGPSGHVVIGTTMAIGFNTTLPTKNIVIDGSFAGEGQYLEFRGGDVGGNVIVFYGDVTQTTVRNCRVINLRTAGDINHAINFRTQRNTDNKSVGVVLENCYLQTAAASLANHATIIFNGSESTSTAGYPTNCVVRNNEIVSKLRAIFFNCANGAIIEGNTFNMSSTPSGLLAQAVLGSKQTGTIVVCGNKFIEMTTQNTVDGNYGIQAITASGGADQWIIENNYFAGLDAVASSAAGKAIKMTYVRCGDYCVVRHNTFYMPSFTRKPSTELWSNYPISCLYLAGAQPYSVENNIFVCEETQANVSLIRGGLNNNVQHNVFYHKGGNAAVVAVSSTSISTTWEDFTGSWGERGSVWKKPVFVDAAVGDLALKEADEELLMQRLADVPTDINGRERAENTYAGAFEYMRENLALNKPSYAGFVEGANVATNANDGKLGTRWSSYGTDCDNAWWYVDLGDEYVLNEIQIWFETAHPKSFLLQKATTLPTDVTDDALWTTLYVSEEEPNVGDSEENMNSYQVSGRARYVRIRPLTCSHDGISMYEFCVYGTPVDERDGVAPTVTSADIVGLVNDGQLKLHLTAEDQDGTPVKTFRIIDQHTGKKYKLITDEDDCVTLFDTDQPYSYCAENVFHIQAMDNSGNYSEVHVLTGVVDNLPENFNPAATGEASASKMVGGYEPSKALDNVGSYWASGTVGTNEQVWWQVDLATTYRPYKIQVAWNNSYPKLYYWEVSTDGENYYPAARYTISPESADINSPALWVDYDITDTLPARFVRLRVDNTTGEVALRFVRVFAECYSGDDKPVMTYAELDNILRDTEGVAAYISLGAYDDTTPFEQLKYKVEFIGDGVNVEKTVTDLTATGGLLTLTGLEEGAAYTIRLYAIDADGNVSDNFKQIDFTADSKVSLYYLTGANPDNAAGVWSDALKSEESAAKRRFSYTDNAGVYRFNMSVNGNEEYRLYYDSKNSIGSKFTQTDTDWSTAGNIAIPSAGTIVVYATDKEHFVSNFDYLYVYGDAVGAANKADAKLMTYDAENNRYTWEGDVVYNNTFRIVANAQQDAGAAKERVIDPQLFNLYATRAQLVFDVATWTVTWTPIDDDDPDICTQSGGPGSGFIYDGSCEFTDGYELKMYKAAENSIQVTVSVFDNRQGLANAYFRNYENYNPQDNSFEIREYPMTKVNDNTFTLTLTPDLVDHRYEGASQQEQDKYKIIPDWDKGTAIRYAVKFEFAMNNEGCSMSITGPDYYYMQVGCAPDTFYIYHKGQAPTDNDIDEYEGTVIPQPIQYRRKFAIDTWYSVCFPFEVTAVKVYDKDDDAYYDLLPYYRANAENSTYNGGHYIIRTPWPTDTRTMPIDNFEDKTGNYGWHDPETQAGWLPQKNTPYIIQFHNSYYKDKWICFFGGEYTNIDEDFYQGDRPFDNEQITVYGNNIMMPASVTGQSYHLNNDEWYRKDDGATVNPFECYLLANEQTTARYMVIRRGAGEDIPVGGGTATGIAGPQTDALIPILRIYSATGVLLKEYRNTTFVEAAEHWQSVASQGVYMFVADEQTWKIMTGGR